jgi:DNA-binding NarL/FixJ family response regulator
MASGTRRLRVLLAHGDRLFLQRLMSGLAADRRVDVVGYTCDGEEVVELAIALRPDVILIAAELPPVDVGEVTRRIRAGLPSACVLLTSSDPLKDVARTHEAGAAGFVTEDSSAPDLLVTALALSAVMSALERNRPAEKRG